MTIPSIVLDTNVLVSALKTRRGAAFRLLSLTGTGLFDIHLSVPLLFEYEDVLRRSEIGIGAADAEAVLDYLCGVARKQEIHFLWRPWLRDPKDDMVLELAVASACSHIVSFNTADFAGSGKFGIPVVRPADFLQSLEVKP
ncbi:MAG: putative toxin-antitoxin system toxin component, PIN family [Pseudoxanthomonas sp.]